MNFLANQIFVLYLLHIQTPLHFFFFFLVALGLCCCLWAFSSCSKWGLLLVVELGLLLVVASLVMERRL